MEQIEIGQRSVSGIDCAFLWLYAKDGKPYVKYLDQEVPDPNVTIPMVMCLLRWDGTFGTTGGKVDDGETLLQGLVREVAEEIDYTIPEGAKVLPLATFRMDGNHIHSFCQEVTYEELKRIRLQAHQAPHFDAECAGCNLIQATDFKPAHDGKPRGIQAFLQNSFCATSKLELELLLARIRG